MYGFRYLDQDTKMMIKRKQGQKRQNKADDAGGLTPVKEDNDVMPLLDR